MSEDTNPKTETHLKTDDEAAVEAPPEEPALDDDEELDDETPQDGDILEPGLHLIELATRVPCRREILLEGMKRIGFDGILADQSRARTEQSFAIREHRFIANLTRSVTIHQREAMTWTYARRLTMQNIGRDVRDYRLKLEAFSLEPGVLYEALFMSRERTQPSRTVVEDHLSTMGFATLQLTAVQRDARITGRQQTSVTIWFGLLEWDSTASIVTEEDPFYFEELIPI